MDDLVHQYAYKWEQSSKFLFDKGYYSWMSSKIKPFNNILEIGCGTGYGTLSLVKEGHNVIAVEKNETCIAMADKLIKQNNLDAKVTFISGDIITGVTLPNIFDVVICWNPGIGAVTEEKVLIDYCNQMIQYGITLDSDNLESTYVDLLLEVAGKIAREKDVPLHIIDRCMKESDNNLELYFQDIKNAIGFDNMEIDYLRGETFSDAGVPLQLSGMKIKQSIIQTTFTSVLMK